MEPSVSVPMAKSAQPRRHRGGRSGTRPAGTLVQVPRVARLAAEPDVAVGERAERGLAEQHRARLPQQFDHPRIAVGDAILVRRRAPGGADAVCVEQVLQAVRDAVQRAEPRAGAQQRVRGVGLRARQIGRHRHETLQRAGVLGDAREVDLGQAPAAEQAVPDPVREPGGRSERHILVAGGEGARVGRGGAQHGVLRQRREIGEPRIETAGGRQAVGEQQLASRLRRRDLAVEIVEHQFALGARIREPHQPLAGGDRLNADCCVGHAAPASPVVRGAC